MESSLHFDIAPQPDDTTCGPTCLQAVYRFFGDAVPLSRVVREVPNLDTGGTLGVLLAAHALRRGYGATIYTYNLQIFDPTWFEDGVDLRERLGRQREQKKDVRIRAVSDAYEEFFSLGGVLRYRDLTAGLIRRYLRRDRPILTGLSATYLYGCAREIDDDYDDVRGEPSGHFVVLCGYDPALREVQVADPQHDNPKYGSRYYSVGIDRLVGAILLGILTHDANLLVLEPPPSRARE